MAVWFVAARAVGNDILLAGPGQTAEALTGALGTASFWEAVAHSGTRIVITALLSAVAGTAAGLAAGAVPWLRHLLAPVIHVMKSAPVACVIVVLLVVIGSSGAVAAIIAFVAAPPFYVAALEVADRRRDDTQRVLTLLGATPLQVFLAATWPAILPFFLTAAKTSMGLAWRAGVTGELLGIPLGSIGAAVYTAKLTLDTAGLLGWTVTVMVLGWLCEKAFVALLATTKAAPRLALRLAMGRHGHGRDDSREDLAGCERPDVSERTRIKDGFSLAPAQQGGGEPAPAILISESQRNSYTQQGEDEPAPAGAADDAAGPIVLLDGISKSFDGCPVLADVTLEARPGESLCLMAPTGTGKTTLLRILLGLEKPDGGIRPFMGKWAPVLQGSALVEDLSAYGNVMLTAASGPDAPSPSVIRRAVEELLPVGCADKLARDLSGGTRRLVEIARAMFAKSDGVVLDEPFAGLDEQTRRRACAFIGKHRDGRLLIVATHEAEDAGLLGASVKILQPLPQAASSGRDRA